jgi:hypothetical protein
MSFPVARSLSEARLSTTAAALIMPFDLSFGGVKSSCYGREKVFEALLGSTWVKTITIRHG